MISPQTYVDMYIAGKSVKEIKKEIEKLKRRIRELKRMLENPSLEVEPFVCPHPLVQISVTFDYIEEARKYLYEKTGELYMTKSDERAFIFAENLENIVSLKLHISGFFNPAEPVTIKFVDDKVIRIEYDEEVLDYDKKGFLEDFGRLKVGYWRRHYDTSRFGYDVCDGEQWELTVEYLSGKKEVFGGSNAYPYNFDELCNLFEINRNEE